jgi:4-amino-4-deoxy-L-arabinose transferase-like glycosyltransferase
MEKKSKRPISVHKPPSQVMDDTRATGTRSASVVASLVGDIPAHGNRLQTWLSRRRRLVLAVIIIASVAVRVVYFVQINASPLRYQDRWDQTDMNYFDDWARDIANGDWLTNQSLHPVYKWQRDIAQVYYRKHPEALAALSNGTTTPPSPDEAAKAIWNRWYGQKTFHQEPLYPYLIALTYKTFGPDVRWVFVWQLLVGVMGNILVYVITRRYFGDVVAALAGLMAVLASPILYYEMLLLRESLITVAGLALVYLMDQSLERNTWKWWLATGLAFGASLLLKAIFALMILPVLGVLAVLRRRSLKGLLGSAGVFLVGVAAGVSPMIVRNVLLGLPPIGPSSVGAITYVCTNTPDYPSDGSFAVSNEYVADIMDRTNGKFLPAVIETLKMHPSIGNYLSIFWGKFAASWHWHEIPDNSNFYYYRMHASILNMPMTFFVISPLSLVGLVLAASKIRRLWPLYMLVLSSLAIMLIFYPASRFRVPMMIAMIPFAALTVVRTVAWVYQGRRAPAGAAIVATVLLAVWTSRPLSEGQWLIRPADYAIPYLTYYLPQAQQAENAGEFAQAAAILGKSFRYQPPVIAEIEKGRRIRDEDEMKLVQIFGMAHAQYSAELRKSGDTHAAAVQAQIVQRLSMALNQVPADDGRATP